MTRWIEKRLEPGEKVLFTFRTGRKRAIVFGFNVLLLSSALMGLLWLLMGPEFADQNWILLFALLVVTIFVMSAFSRTVITNKRILHRVQHLIMSQTKEALLKDITEVRLAPHLGTEMIAIRHAIGQYLSINTVDQPAQFLDALLEAHEFNDLKVIGRPTSMRVNIVGSLLALLQIPCAFYLAFLAGAVIWDQLTNLAQDSSPILQIILTILLILMPIIGFIVGGLLVAFFGIVLFTRFFGPDDLRQVVSMSSTLDGQAGWTGLNRWWIRVSEFFARRIYGRPVDLTPPESTVSSPT